MSQTEAQTTKRRFSIGRILAVGVSLALVLFWLWIFTGGPRKANPDFLGDRGWVTSADKICATAEQRVDALPGAEESPNSTQRAVVVDQATDDLEKMVDRLAANSPDNPGDLELVEQWLGDYRSYLASRRTYADDLPADPGARLLFDEKFTKPVDDVIATFAQVNNMPSCEPPGDVS